MHVDSDNIPIIHCSGCLQPETTGTAMQLPSSSSLKGLNRSTSEHHDLKDLCQGVVEAFHFESPKVSPAFYASLLPESVFREAFL